MDVDTQEDKDNLDIIKWTPEHEEILIEWADKAMCYRWLHSKSNAMYGNQNAWYTIPVIIISTLTGAANFAQSRVPIYYRDNFTIIIGFFNILAGVITTIQQFLKITQLNEAHRVSSITWDKFYRNIKIELTRHPSERLDPNHMLKINKEEFDRLIETSPSIPENIIAKFNKKFKDTKSFDKIIKPEICGILIPSNDFRNPWFNDENKAKSINDNFKIELVKQNKIKKINELNNKIVSDFIKLFINLNNREPMDVEITDNLQDKIDIDTLKKLIDENRIVTINDNNMLSSV